MDSLKSARLQLDPLLAVDAAIMFEGLSNSRLYEFIGDEPPKTIAALHARYQRLEARMSPTRDAHWLNWVVRRHSTREAIGYVQATVSGQEANIAYIIFAGAWERGYGREAVRAMIVHLRETYAVHRCLATVDPENRRSCRLLAALGFTLDTGWAGTEVIRGVVRQEVRYVL